MQLEDIVGEVRKTLGEVEPSGYGTQSPGQGTWDNSQIIGYVNEAIGLLSHSVRAESVPVVVTLNTSTNAYNLPADCLEDGLRKVTYTSVGAQGPVSVIPLDFDQFQKLLVVPPYSIGGLLSRYYYTVWAGQVLFTPYPQQNTDTATIYYYKTLPLLVNATDVPLVPVRFHIALVHFATSRCQEAVEESNLQQLAYQNLEIVANQIRVEMSRKSRDRNRVRSR